MENIARALTSQYLGLCLVVVFVVDVFVVDVFVVVVFVVVVFVVVVFVVLIFVVVVFVVIVFVVFIVVVFIVVVFEGNIWIVATHKHHENLQQSNVIGIAVKVIAGMDHNLCDLQHFPDFRDERGLS